MTTFFRTPCPKCKTGRIANIYDETKCLNCGFYPKIKTTIPTKKDCPGSDRVLNSVEHKGEYKGYCPLCGRFVVVSKRTGKMTPHTEPFQFNRGLGAKYAK